MRRACEEGGRLRADPPRHPGRPAGKRKAAAAAILTIAVPLFAGCTGTGAPPETPGARESLSDPYGCWIELEGKELDPGRKVAGEFLAVGADSVYVLEHGAVRAVGRQRIAKARLVTFRPALGTVTAWATLGALSTLSHGVGLVFSLPIWLITSIVTHGEVKGQAIARWPQEDWDRLSRFARFPQGPPPVLHRPRP